MIHLGDITKIDGHKVPIVDCVIGGSPCQGLSNAGKRLGLDDERSGLYMEQIRVIKEMREHDRIRRGADEPVSPRHMVWENVVGALSTGTPKGADFAIVLEEAIRIAEPEAPSIPIPPKGWNTSGCIVDGLGRWSLAWRVTDAQYWGVPQRRRRICMVVDFNGVTAPRIVFEELQRGRSTVDTSKNKAARHTGGERGREIPSLTESLLGDLEKGEGPGKESAGGIGSRAADASRGAIDSEAVVCLEGNGSRPSHHGDGYIESDTMYTLNTTERHAVAYGVDMYNQAVTGDVAKTLNAAASDADHVPCIVEPQPICIEMTATKNTIVGDGTVVDTYQEVTGPLMANSHPGSYTGQDAYNDMLVAGVDCRNMNESPELYPTLQAKPNGGQSLNYSHAVRTKYIVRRLTPLECERLQGFPDGWTDIGDWVDSKGKRHKAADSPRFRALGNSISIPNWKFIIKRLCAHYERDATMASLFDGIGGFPYIWEQINGKGSCLWASEIEEFPMAVTKLRFGG